MAMNLGSFAGRVVATIVVALDGTGDTTDIQAGINLLPPGGGVVYIREGTYTITTAISIPNNNIALIGSGSSTVIQTTSNITMIYTNFKDNLLIEKLKLDGAGDGNASNYGIRLLQSDSSIIRNCWITDCGNIALRVDTSNDVLVEGNIIYDNWDDGIAWWGASVRGTAINNLCDSNVGDNISITVGGNYFTCIGNQCNNSTENYGILFNAMSYAIAANNQCNNNYLSGIGLLNCSNSIVEGSICKDNDQASIGHSGIRLITGCDENIVSNNRCSGNNYGVGISNPNCDKNIVLGNQLKGNTTSAINDSGTSTEKAHNIEV